MIKIGLPNTPAKFVSEPKITDITRILVTAGTVNAVGTSTWYEYLKISAANIRSDRFLTTRNHFDKFITLNPNFIVKAEEMKLVAIAVDSENPNYKGLRTYYYVIPKDEEVCLVNEFTNDGPDFIGSVAI
jgi:hypothetical protein